MTWVKLDDGFFRNPKAMKAGIHGRALHLAGCCWVAANLTDGFIPDHALRIIASDAEVKPGVVAACVDAGLWHVRPGGWEIHGYLERNPSRAQVEKDRARWRGYKRGSTSDSTADSTAESNGDSNEVPTRVSRPVPSPSTGTYIHSVLSSTEQLKTNRRPA